MALNMLKAETTSQGGVAAKRKRAGWDEDYLLLVLAQENAIALSGYPSALDTSSMERMAATSPPGIPASGSRKFTQAT